MSKSLKNYTTIGDILFQQEWTRRAEHELADITKATARLEKEAMGSGKKREQLAKFNPLLMYKEPGATRDGTRTAYRPWTQ
ncbi:unnamed protein product [Clonostachys rosea f. rosea IK726]|uniref:Uncharacterized protein n=1 Tax=Clonostachys rosea f. rosea IK726 TaxID=1349383 RepID=A0ACA9TXB1_BIOOC|nr:unnamed protein product [Clonostachys rosea f. rosea IK726]